MAEVAGTIVGFTSLSITLCEKLSEYVSSVKDAKKKAVQITRELDTLENILEYLDTVASRMDLTPSIALVKTMIQQCALSIESIRKRVRDVMPATTKSRSLSTRSRKVIKRLLYPFKEGDIRYWREVLSSMRQNLQIALLAVEMDRSQRNSTIVQLQLGQVSLTMQTILDQQRRAQAAPSYHFIGQSQSPGEQSFTSRSHPASIQRLIGEHERISTQDAFIHLQSQSLLVAKGRYAPVPSQRLPVAEGRWDPFRLESATSALAEEISTFRHLTRISRLVRSGLARRSRCTCREGRLGKQIPQPPLAFSRNEAHYHNPSCPVWKPRGHDTISEFGMILCSLILGLRFSFLLRLHSGNDTFSIMPSLSIRRVVTVDSSPSFKLIESVTDDRFTCRSSGITEELYLLFETRQATPHDRLKDGETLLHFFCERVSSMALSAIDDDRLDCYRSFLQLFFVGMTYADAVSKDYRGRTWVDLLLQRAAIGTEKYNCLKALASEFEDHYPDDWKEPEGTEKCE